ncbi:MAG: type III PLP-dependent enzyme [Deltaproteobacteria bacterium]|nr:type III PLP-dependent enzyme [Deltaproteobacteria bacterium]
MNLLAALLSRFFPESERELIVGGIPVRALVARYGTPLFLYDSDILDRKWNLLRHALPEQFTICYSVKANPNPSFLKHFLAKGCGLEIASGGEFYLALRAACPPAKILFAGPGKTEEELELVLSRDIGEIHVESLREAERISALSRRLGRRARVAIRVNPGGEAQGGAMRMGGKAAPFGIDEENLECVVDRIINDSWLEFRGLHLFTGTQILDAAVLLTQYRKGIEIARRVVQQGKSPLHTLDFGGGLGIPYFANDVELDMARLQEGLADLMAEVVRDPSFAGTQFIVEPGRYLIGEAGLYLVRVIDIKISRGKKFLVVDGGMNHHLAASGNLGQVIKRNFPLALVNKLTTEDHETVDVVGPLCTPLDVLARDVQLPPAAVGDCIGVFQSGAYARAASPLGFLSHTTPPEVLVSAGQPLLIRRRGVYEDLVVDVPS